MLRLISYTINYESPYLQLKIQKRLLIVKDINVLFNAKYIIYDYLQFIGFLEFSAEISSFPE